MHARLSELSRVRSNRSALSFVEFVGCLCALSGGVVLGSFYLGVDMKTMCASLLEQAEVISPGFFDTQSTADEENAEQAEPTAEDAVEGEATNSEEVAASSELGESSSDQESNTEQLATESADSDTEAVEETIEPELSPAEKVAATKEFWKGLGQAIELEVARRTTNPGDPENWQLFDYLSHRAEGHEKALDTIDGLESLGVDPKVLIHTKQVRTWHQAGAKLYRRAVQLLTDSTNDSLTGPFAQSWQSAATQHRMEEQLLRDKHASLARFLEHSFKATLAEDTRN